MLKRKRVAAYIRVSKDRYEQKSSLKNQEEQIIQYANDNGYIIVEFYKDIETGTIENRDDFERLLKDAREDKFDVIISKELSRLARNVALSYKIKMITEDFNIGLITLDGSINTLEGCEELYGLHSWLAEHEAKKTSIRLKDMLTTRARNGLFNGSIPPYGYYCKKG